MRDTAFGPVDLKTRLRSLLRPMTAQDPKRFHHPGEGRRRAVPHPKGRQVDPDAVKEVRALLGAEALQRDLLIAEGIPVDAAGRLPLAQYRWSPGASCGG